MAALLTRIKNFIGYSGIVIAAICLLTLALVFFYSFGVLIVSGLEMMFTEDSPEPTSVQRSVPKPDPRYVLVQQKLSEYEGVLPQLCRQPPSPKNCRLEEGRDEVLRCQLQFEDDKESIEMRYKAGEVFRFREVSDAEANKLTACQRDANCMLSADELAKLKKYRTIDRPAKNKRRQERDGEISDLRKTLENCQTRALARYQKRLEKRLACLDEIREYEAAYAQQCRPFDVDDSLILRNLFIFAIRQTVLDLQSELSDPEA